MKPFEKKYPRQPQESYFTPAWVTETLLLNWQPIAGSAIYDPACGDGGLLAPMSAAGHDCAGSDLRGYPHTMDWGAPPRLGVDFLDRQNRDVAKLIEALSTARRPLTIYANPPYGHCCATALAFVRRALELTQPSGGSVVMLLPFAFDAAKERRDIFCQHPARPVKLVLLDRIRWANVDQKAAGPTKNHALFIWEWDPARRPLMRGRTIYARRGEKAMEAA